MTYPASVRRARRRGPVYGGGFLPQHLFRSGEQGVWYDPSDLSTLFQDSAGTTPVTADGDPVGLMLDKSGNDNHATQTVSAARPTYQRGDSRGVVNLLKWSEAFGNAVWIKGTNVTVTENQGLGGDGSLTADRVTYTGGAGISTSPRLESNTGGLTTASKEFTVSAWVVSVSGTSTIRLKNTQGGVVDNYSSNIIVTTTPMRVSFTVANGASAGSGVQFAGIVAGTANAAFDIYIWGAQLEEGSTATPYQRNDSHLGGVATGLSTDLRWLKDDKVDDVMTATLPAMPTATVATSTDDGVVITYPVNIPAGAYSVDTTSTLGIDYGRVIVDRELTASETTALTTFLNEKAGI